MPCRIAKAYEMRHARNRDWLIALLLIVSLAVIGYGVLLKPDRVPYSPYSDIISYHLAAKEVLFRSIQAGQGVSYWRADQLSGGPAFTSPNALYTYPLHILFYLFPPVAVMGWTIWLQIVAGACVFYWVGQSLGLGRWPRLLMAVAALFNFKVLMAVYAGWLSVLPSITFPPLLFAIFYRLVRCPTLRSALAFAAVGGLCLHGGHIQLVYYSGLFLVAYTAVAFGHSWRAGRSREMRRSAGWLAASGVLAIGMAAYLLVPLMAEMPLVSRGLASKEFFFSHHYLGWRHLLTFFHPEALGSPLDRSYAGIELWEDVAYFGLLPLLLAFFGGILGWRRPATRFLVVSFAVSALIALDTPLVHFLYEFLPGFRTFRLPGRMLFLTAWFGIALAGIGLEELLARTRGEAGLPWRSALAALAMILVIAGEGAFYSYRYLDTVPRAEAAPATDYGRFLASDPALFRVAPVGPYTMTYGWAAAEGLQLISGYEPFNLRHYQKYLLMMQLGGNRVVGGATWTDFLRVARWDLLDVLNVKYILARKPQELPPDRFEVVEQYPNQPQYVLYWGMRRDNVTIFRNKGFLPRIFWAPRIVAARDEDEAIAEIQRHSLREFAVVQEIERQDGEMPSSPGDQARVVHAADGYLEVETKNLGDRYLVISEVWHPGWRATLDGNPHPLYRTDLTLMGTWLPAGEHRLALAFRPLYWPVALGISLVSGAAFLLCVVVYLVRLQRMGPETSTGASGRS
jgi:hypothetical protein